MNIAIKGMYVDVLMKHMTVWRCGHNVYYRFPDSPHPMNHTEYLTDNYNWPLRYTLERQ